MFPIPLKPSFKCTESVLPAKTARSKVSPESHRSAPYFPQRTNFSSTCDSTIAFTFSVIGGEMGPEIKTTGSNFSNICYWVCRRRRRRRSKAKVVICPICQSFCHLSKKLQNPQMQSCLSLSDLQLTSDRTFVSSPFLMSCGPQSYSHRFR